MALANANTCEGGTDTVTVSGANSGGVSGTAWSSVSGSPVFSSTKPGHGSLSVKFSGSSVQACTWTFTGVATIYVQLTASPDGFTNSPVFFRTRNGTTQAVRLQLDATGHILVRNTNNLTLYTFTNALSTTLPNGIAITVTPGAGTNTGTVIVSLWVGSNVSRSTPTETTTQSAQNLGSVGTLTEVSFGLPVAPAGAIDSLYLDDFSARDDALPGPVVVTGSGALTSSGTFTGLGRVLVRGSGALTSSGTFTGSGRVVTYGAGAMTAEGILTGAGRVSVNAAAVLSGEGVLSGTGTVVVSAGGVLSGTGTMAGAGHVAVIGSGSLSATATATLEPTVIEHTGARRTTDPVNRADTDPVSRRTGDPTSRRGG